MNGEEGDYSTFVLNGEWALLGMQNTDLIYADKKSEIFIYSGVLNSIESFVFAT